jgi:uncharacterized membrane protein
MFTRLLQKIQNIFLAGLLATVPAIITLLLLRFLVNYIDKVSAPIVNRFFHTKIPGIGLFVTILIVLIAGILGTNILGRKLVSIGERILSKIPLVRSIYASAKQAIETVLFANVKPFRQIVLVPYPRQGMYAIGFVTREVPPAMTIPIAPPDSQSPGDTEHDQIFSVFIPNTPNVTGGLVLMYPRREMIPLDMTIEEGFKYLMTGGILTPKKQLHPETGQELEEWELFLQ